MTLGKQQRILITGCKEPWFSAISAFPHWPNRVNDHDETFGTLRCSFCGRRSFEITGLVEGNGVAICRGCVEDFYQGFHEPGDP